jgi:glycine hydroxymethyltransferase
MQMKAYYDALAASDHEIYQAIRSEERRQTTGVEMIPSENYTYPEVLAALGSVFTNKYAEGYPGRRYYGGQEYTDVIERAACERVCRLFGAQHANVQPLSGSPMNQAVYFAVLQPGATVLAMDLTHGGHLTHGAPVSHMGKVFQFKRYKTDPANHGAINFDEVRRSAQKHRPRLLLCGYSSYPRDLDYAEFKAIADEVGALTMADVAHIGGLIAAGCMRNPIDAGFDIVTCTTHKTMRGPRGGFILCRKDFARAIDASVFPGLQGGPHMNNIAAAAIAFKKAGDPDFRDYAQRILNNARALAATLLENGVELITGGTENHLMVIDTIKSFNMDGSEAERTLDRIGITTNKQMIPDDPRPPLHPSGIRLGTPACTTRGMNEQDMKSLATWLVAALRAAADDRALEKLAAQVHELCLRYPVPGVSQLSN